MGMLCAVVFGRNGQLFYANPGDLQLSVGDRVLYPTEHEPVAATGAVAARVHRRGHRRLPDAGRMGDGRRRGRRRADQARRRPGHWSPPASWSGCTACR